MSSVNWYDETRDVVLTTIYYDGPVSSHCYDEDTYKQQYVVEGSRQMCRDVGIVALYGISIL